MNIQPTPVADGPSPIGVFDYPTVSSSFNRYTTALTGSAALWNVSGTTRRTDGNVITPSVAGSNLWDGFLLTTCGKNRVNTASSVAVIIPSAPTDQAGVFPNAPIGQIIFVPSSGGAASVVANYVFIPIVTYGTVIVPIVPTPETAPFTTTTVVAVPTGAFLAIVSPTDHRATHDGIYQAVFASVGAQASTSAILIGPSVFTVNELSSSTIEESKACNSRPQGNGNCNTSGNWTAGRSWDTQSCASARSTSSRSSVASSQGCRT